MKLYRKINRITSRYPVLVMLNICIFLLSGHMNLFANQEFSSPATYQTESRTVKGTVTDDAGVPIPGVNVVIKGTTIGVVTDTRGTFSITVSTDDAVLVFSFVGFVTQEISVGIQTEINVTLGEDTQQIEEVVVIGYGDISKKKLSTAITKVAGSAINKQPVANTSDALAGIVAGVQVQAGSGGMPGAAPIIRIRGVGSMTASNAPLYVVDGYPGQGLGGINPDDIESIEILKDAASAAIYGSRAANGVVIVTTKRGKAGYTNFSASAYTGIQQISKKYEVMNRDEYLQYAKDAAAGVNEQYPDIFDHPEQCADTDWQDEIFRVAPQSEFRISASGGSEKVQYAISGSYLTQDGTLLGTDYQRGSLRVNIDAKLSNSLKIGVNFAPAVSQTHGQAMENDLGITTWGNGSPIYGALIMSPIVPVHKENGDYGQMVEFPYRQYAFVANNFNPVAILELNERENNDVSMMNNIFLQWEPVKGLVLKTQGGFTFSTSTYDQYVPSTLGHIAAFTANLSTPDVNGIRAQSTNSKATNWIWENTANYSVGFKSGHNLSALLLFSMEKSNSRSFGATGTVGKFTTDLVHNPTANSVIVGSMGYGLSSFMSYAGRINYDYKERYILSAALRTDASSRFGSANRYATFPSVSVAWRIAEEPFMANQNIFSELKVRGSWGKTGNASIGDFTWMSGIYNLYYSFNNERATGSIAGGFQNTELTWEKNQQVDVGLEVAFLKDRVYVTFDYYQKLTEGMLFSKELPAHVGYATTFTTNIGQLRNRGMELAVNTRNFIGEFQWTTAFNISANRTKVLDLGGREQLNPLAGANYPRAYQVKVGEPLGNMTGFIIDGVVKTQEQLENNPQWTGTKVGDYQMRSMNDDNVVNEQDRTKLGNGYPDFIYGMTNTFQYKNFDLSIIIQGTYGNDIIHGTGYHTELWIGRMNARKDMVNNYFMPDDPMRDVKYAQVGNQRGGFWPINELHSYAVYDGSFLRVRNITLGYTLPAQISNAIFLKSARIYLSTQNPFTFTKYPGYNPEPSFSGDSPYQPGAEKGAYPSNRSFVIGVNVNF